MGGSRKVRKRQCTKCCKEFHPGVLRRHLESCGQQLKKSSLDPTWRRGNKFECPFCQNLFSPLGIKLHIFRKHTENGRNLDSNKGYSEGTRTAWNKGVLTSEKTRKKLSLLLSGREGSKHTEASKKKLSETRKRLIAEGKVKMWNGTRSYPEQYFDEIFSSWKMKFEKQFHVWSGEKNYFLDFFFPAMKIAVEIDGAQHFFPDRRKSDIVRDSYLNSVGITVLRIRWKNPKLDSSQDYFRLKLTELRVYLAM